MARIAYLAPFNEPDGANYFLLDVPNVPEYRALLRGIFLELTDPAAWEEIPGITIDAQTAADWATVMYDSFEENQQCP